MIKYAMRAEELEEIYKLLAGKPQIASQAENQ
jgi:hypothetical protein